MGRVWEDFYSSFTKIYKIMIIVILGSVLVKMVSIDQWT